MISHHHHLNSPSLYHSLFSLVITLYSLSCYHTVFSLCCYYVFTFFVLHLYIRVQQASKSGHFLMARPGPDRAKNCSCPPGPTYTLSEPGPARPGSVQGSTIISNLFYKKDFHTMELNDHFSNLSEHCERFIIMVIIS